MKYEDIRPKIQSGDIIALSHFKWASLYDLQIQAVRVFTQSEFSHVGLAWVVGERVFVLESVMPFVRITPLSNFTEDGFYWVPMSTPIGEEELNFALSKVGNGKYSKWQAMMGQLRKLKIGEDNLWQCCEYVLECRKRSGVYLGDKATPSAIVASAQTQGSPVYFINQK